MKSLPINSAETNPAIGARLRNHRRRQHMTIDQLAEASGLTKGFISRVERDQASPSLNTLLTLCAVLRINIGDLLAEPETTHITWEEAPLVDLGGTGITEKLVSARGLNAVQVLRAEIEPGGHGESEKYTVDCETEIVHLISGELTLETTQGEHHLTEGDTLTFPGTEPHTWHNPGGRHAVVVWVLIAK